METLPSMHAPLVRGAKFSDLFGIGPLKIYLIGSIVPVFANRIITLHRPNSDGYGVTGR